MMENNSSNHSHLSLATKRLSKKVKRLQEKQAVYKEMKQTKKGIFSALFRWFNG